MMLHLFLALPSWLRTMLLMLITAAVMGLYGTLVYGPSIAKEARKQFVHISEVASLKAELNMQKILTDNARIAADNYSKALSETHKQHLEDEQRLQEEIKHYEARLHSLGRNCPLDHRDIEWLSKP